MTHIICIPCIRYITWSIYYGQKWIFHGFCKKTILGNICTTKCPYKLSTKFCWHEWIHYRIQNWSQPMKSVCNGTENYTIWNFKNSYYSINYCWKPMNNCHCRENTLKISKIRNEWTKLADVSNIMLMTMSETKYSFKYCWNFAFRIHYT